MDNNWSPEEIDKKEVALLDWGQNSELAKAIEESLQSLSYRVSRFQGEKCIPESCEILFTFGPFGPILPTLEKAAELADRRPRVVHWNFEGLPDLRIPWPAMKLLGDIRSALERFLTRHSIGSAKCFTPLRNRFMRFRYLGDYYYASGRGWLDVFADTSQIYAAIHNRRGLSTHAVPWGSSSSWYADLKLERDIDVLWMGKYATRRRRRIIRELFQALKQKGLKVYCADNEENPFIFGRERVHFLNRSKIILNVARTWYDDNFLRFFLAAPNRALFLSEPLPPHCPELIPGEHYVVAPVDRLLSETLRMLKDEAQRRRICRNAHRLATEELTFDRSVEELIGRVEGGVWKRLKTPHS